jgi:hypothetical protein
MIYDISSIKAVDISGKVYRFFLAKTKFSDSGVFSFVLIVFPVLLFFKVKKWLFTLPEKSAVRSRAFKIGRTKQRTKVNEFYSRL